MKNSGRIGCPSCNWLGYVTSSFFYGGIQKFQTTVCPTCKDFRGYHAYIKEKYGQLNNLKVIEGGLGKEADVIDFNHYRKTGKIKYLGGVNNIDEYN